MNARTTFFVLICLSLAVALIGEPRGPALVLAGVGAFTALFGFIRDREAGR